MELRKCDRCGSIFEKKQRMYWLEDKDTSPWLSFPSLQAELCKACTDDLRVWLQAKGE